MTEEETSDSNDQEPREFSEDKKSVVAETSEEDPRPGKGGDDE